MIEFSLELGEDVRVFRRYPVGLQHRDPHGELLADLEVRREIVEALLLLVLARRGVTAAAVVLVLLRCGSRRSLNFHSKMLH